MVCTISINSNGPLQSLLNQGEGPETVAARPLWPMARVMSLYLSELRSLAVHTDKWTSSSCSFAFLNRELILYNDTESTEIGIHLIFSPAVFFFSSNCDRGVASAARENQSHLPVSINWTCHRAIMHIQCSLPTGCLFAIVFIDYMCLATQPLASAAGHIH